MTYLVLFFVVKLILVMVNAKKNFNFSIHFLFKLDNFHKVNESED